MLALQRTFLHTVLETVPEAEKHSVSVHVSTLFKERLWTDSNPQIIVFLYEEWELLNGNNLLLFTVSNDHFEALNFRYQDAELRLAPPPLNMET